MMSFKYFTLILILLLVSTGYKNELSHNTDDEVVGKMDENVGEGNELDSYSLSMDFYPNNDNERIDIIEYDNYSNSFKLVDVHNTILYECEISGRIEEIKILDINQDNLKDLLVVTDAGGSSGKHHYQLYSYNKGVFEETNFNEFDASNRFEVELEKDSVSVAYKNEENDKEVFLLTEDTKSTLIDLGVNEPNNYYWSPQMLTHYFNNNNEIIIVSRSQLMIEHHLLVVAEVIVEYGFRDGNWIPIRWEVKNEQY